MALLAGAQEALALQEVYELWPFWVHIVSDVVDLASLVWWLLDCDLLTDDFSPTTEFSEDKAFESVVYLVVLGLMLPVFGVLIHVSGRGGPGTPLRRAYLYGEVAFDLGEGALFAYLAKDYGGHGVRPKIFAVMVLMVFTTGMDYFIVKGPEVIEDLFPGTFDANGSSAPHSYQPTEPGEAAQSPGSGADDERSPRGKSNTAAKPVLASILGTAMMFAAVSPHGKNASGKPSHGNGGNQDIAIQNIAIQQPTTTIQQPTTNTPAPTTAPAPAFDCNANFAMWTTAWSPAKMEWCCQETGRGCETGGRGNGR